MSVARPREKNISKWGYWKRNQRDRGSKGKCSNCGKQGATDWQHKDGKPSNNSKSNTIRLCRSCHVKVDNRLGRHKKKR